MNQGIQNTTTSQDVKLVWKETDTENDPPLYSEGDVVAEGVISNKVSNTEYDVSVTSGEFVHEPTMFNIVVHTTTVQTVKVTENSLDYHLQLYMLVRVGGGDDDGKLKYMPITRDDVKAQKNDMMDKALGTSLLDSSYVFDKLVNFGERIR